MTFFEDKYRVLQILTACIIVSTQFTAQIHQYTDVDADSKSQMEWILNLKLFLGENIDLNFNFSGIWICYQQIVTKKTTYAHIMPIDY